MVIGGGVVGLSVAAGLVNTAGKDRTTFLVERRGLVHLPSKLSDGRKLIGIGVAWAGDYVCHAPEISYVTTDRRAELGIQRLYILVFSEL